MNKTILLIPHYNNPLGLMKSLSSINSIENIDVLVVDDGSNNKPFDEGMVNNSFNANGSVFYIYSKVNQGIEFALNSGLEFIIKKNQYQFIARLDCGDVCLGNRFQIQEVFLINNPKIKLIGSNSIAVDPFGKFLYKTIYPQKHKEIQKKMFVNSMFLHPTVMFAIDVLPVIGRYPLNYKSAEDYAFFFKFVQVYETGNLQDFLVQYEINQTGISFSKRTEQVSSRIRVIWDNYYFGFWPIYGLLRNYLILIIPYSIIQNIKKALK